MKQEIAVRLLWTLGLIFALAGTGVLGQWALRGRTASQSRMGTRFAVEDGCFTGEGELCYGEAKLTAAEAFLADKDVGLEDCAFYTDSYTDLPVMDVVGRPVAVHPDPRLMRHARRAGGEIADWG